MGWNKKVETGQSKPFAEIVKVHHCNVCCTMITNTLPERKITLKSSI